ncbi:MAG: hypothetical protein ABIR36_00425 [Nitrospiraceae bacterium]
MATDVGPTTASGPTLTIDGARCIFRQTGNASTDVGGPVNISTLRGAGRLVALADSGTELRQNPNLRLDRR